jgi:alanyl-tRNA synthetase
MELDKQAFDNAMNEQRERARAARQDTQEQVVIPDLSGLVTENLAYDETVENAKIVLLWKDGNLVDAVHDGEEVAVVLDVTPFHAEGGGQVGDSGLISNTMGKLQILSTKKLLDGTIYQVGHIVEGTLKSGDSVRIMLDKPKHHDTARNHTATHLLHAALKRVLGEHVNQAGSMVTPDRLRFDFSHFAPLTAQQLAEVEFIVNDEVLKNTPLGIIETTKEIAKEMGATALFGEKYGDQVRVVIIGNFSKELCGGSHVPTTAKIGLFKIVSEAGIGSGIRRIEAVTGYGALEYIRTRDEIIFNTTAMLKARPEEVVTRLDNLMEHVKEIEQELAAVNTKLAKTAVQELLADITDIGGVQVVAGQVSSADMNSLRNVADMVRDRLQCGVVILGAVNQDKVNFVVMATSEAIAQGIHAGNIVKEVAKVAGGGGGGRPDMAQAGGKQPEKIIDALNIGIEVIRKQVK